MCPCWIGPPLCRVCRVGLSGWCCRPGLVVLCSADVLDAWPEFRNRGVLRRPGPGLRSRHQQFFSRGCRNCNCNCWWVAGLTISEFDLECLCGSLLLGFFSFFPKVCPHHVLSHSCDRACPLAARKEETTTKEKERIKEKERQEITTKEKVKDTTKEEKDTTKDGAHGIKEDTTTTKDKERAKEKEARQELLLSRHILQKVWTCGSQLLVQGFYLHYSSGWFRHYWSDSAFQPRQSYYRPASCPHASRPTTTLQPTWTVYLRYLHAGYTCN